jgi:hypothetical protein
MDDLIGLFLFGSVVVLAFGFFRLAIRALASRPDRFEEQETLRRLTSGLESLREEVARLAREQESLTRVLSNNVPSRRPPVVSGPEITPH